MPSGTAIGIQLLGPFRLASADGRDLTPSIEKAQALLALLATSRDLRRTRVWLMDKLWSESNRPHAQASLRQTLYTIRRSLGEASSALLCNRTAVWLDPDLVEIDWPGAAGAPEGDFLEGMDIPDPEFEDWLRSMRGTRLAEPAMAPAPRLENAPRWKVVLQGLDDATGGALQLESEFIGLVFRTLSELGGIDLGYHAPSEPDEVTVVVDVRAFRIDADRSGLRLRAGVPHDNHVFWTDTAICAGSPLRADDAPELLALAFRLQAALLRELGKRGVRDVSSSALLGQALPRVFSFRRSALSDVDRLFRENGGDGDNPTLMAWRAQIAVIDVIEQFCDDTESASARGRALAARALEAAPTNSMVLTMAANVKVLLDWSTDDAGELAEQSVRLNPSNPFAWWSYANVALYAGRAEMAMKASKRGSALAARSPFQFWCDFQVGLSALHLGDFDRARRALETSAALAPHFRPPRRYLLGLYAHARDFERAARVAGQLANLEQGFSFDAFLNDPDYPVSLLRRTDALDISPLRELAGG